MKPFIPEFFVAETPFCRPVLNSTSKWINMHMDEKCRFPNTLYLESFLDMHPNSRIFLLDAIKAFHEASIPYALIGSLARKCWMEHRDATKDADILTTDEYSANLRAALRILHYYRKNSSVSGIITLKRDDCPMDLDIMVATAGFDPEESCVHDTVELPLSGSNLSIQLGKPEYLAWMLTSSPHQRHKGDLVRLVSNSVCDAKKLMAFMRYAGDDEAFVMIKTILGGNKFL